MVLSSLELVLERDAAAFPDGPDFPKLKKFTLSMIALDLSKPGTKN